MRVKEIDEIKNAVLKAVEEYPLKKVKLFGSYASNKANDD